MPRFAALPCQWAAHAVRMLSCAKAINTAALSVLMTESSADLTPQMCLRARPCECEHHTHHRNPCCVYMQETLDKWKSEAQMGRPGQPCEVAPCYVFLASEDASYISGQTLHPNGGTVING